LKSAHFGNTRIGRENWRRHSREGGNPGKIKDERTTLRLYSRQSAEWYALYVGVTSDLVKRAWEHRNEIAEGFTKKYGVRRLVHYKIHENMISAITREKQLKKWNRSWKLRLIEKHNPTWRDLWEEVL
jgi:putative endonuclease